jgi:hypothetical protein
MRGFFYEITEAKAPALRKTATSEFQFQLWNFLALAPLPVMVTQLRRRISVPELTPQQIKQRAEARLKIKQEQAIDRPLAMQQYRAAEQAMRDRTAKLRAQRLARDAARPRSSPPPG